MKKIIITGGNGFIGKHLQKELSDRSIPYNILTRTPTLVHEYKWDISTSYIDEHVFDDVIGIIHLAGENIGAKRWTKAQKLKIIDSRVKNTQLLSEYLSKRNQRLDFFIAAGGISYYGDGGSDIQSELMQKGQGFLAEVSYKWEEAVSKLQSNIDRIVVLRTGVVLDKTEGAFPKLLLPIKFGIASPIGHGSQYLSWIHIEDIVYMYIFAIQNKSIQGIFNAVAPNPITNKEFTRILAQQMYRPFIGIGIPKFLIKSILGEMSDVLLMSNRCSSEKIRKEGFSFKYPTLKMAIVELTS